MRHSKMNELEENIDYSRVESIFGTGRFEVFRSSRCLVIGLSHVGVEIVKNLALSGVKEVFVMDSKKIEDSDVGGNFLSRIPLVVGKTRCQAYLPMLRELNNETIITEHKFPLKETLSNNIDDFDYVVICEGFRQEWFEFEEKLREKNVPVFYGGVFGLMGNVLVSLGKDRVKYYDDITQKQHVVQFSNEEKLEIKVVGSSTFPFRSKDRVKLISFDKALLTNKISECTISKIEMKEKSFFLKEEERTKFLQFSNQESVVFAQVVPPERFCRTVSWKHMQTPESPIDLLFSFKKEFGCYPSKENEFKSFVENLRENQRNEILDEEDSDEFESEDSSETESEEDESINAMLEKYIKENKSQSKEKNRFVVDEERETSLVLSLSRTLAPIVSFIAGVLTNEIIKYFQRLYDPLKELFFIEFLDECGKENVDPSILGKSRVVVAGAGATGCEYVKNLVTMGFATKKAGGSILIIDNDLIERSNVSRQLFYRVEDVFRQKALVAAERAVKLNGLCSVLGFSSFLDRNKNLSPEDEIWGRANVISSMLDNINARLFLDEISHFHEVPLIDVGTMGAKICNFVSVFPFKSPSYRSMVGKDASVQRLRAENVNEGSCTAKGIPSNTSDVVRKSIRDFESIGKILSKYWDKVKISRGNENGDEKNIVEMFCREAFQYLFVENVGEDVKLIEKSNTLSSMEEKKPLPVEQSFDPSNKWHNDFLYSLDELLKSKFKGKLIFDKDDAVHLKCVFSMVQIYCVTYKIPLLKGTNSLEKIRLVAGMEPSVISMNSIISAYAAIQTLYIMRMKHKKESPIPVHAQYLSSTSGDQYFVFRRTPLVEKPDFNNPLKCPVLSVNCSFVETVKSFKERLTVLVKHDLEELYYFESKKTSKDMITVNYFRSDLMNTYNDSEFLFKVVYPKKKMQKIVLQEIEEGKDRRMKVICGFSHERVKEYVLISLKFEYSLTVSK